MKFLMRRRRIFGRRRSMAFAILGAPKFCSPEIMAPPRISSSLFTPLLLQTISLSVAAQQADLTLNPVVVSASRVEERSFDTAASIDLVGRDLIQDGQVQATLAEPLQRVPGIAALNRQNYAQDLLISSRGFGANSTFGARGIRIIVDGIPATVADGQGQISHIDLASADRIEVLRGPFSSLYGNSSGGVINVFTENGSAGHRLSPYLEAGSFGLIKGGLKASGDTGGVNYVVDAGKLDVDGFRQHSAASRDNGNAKFRIDLGNDTSLQLVANRLSLTAQDPLGLTAAQVQQNRAQAGSFANAYNTRKTVEQDQGGATLTKQIDPANSIVLSAYYGDRHTDQYQAGTAANGMTAAVNGVIDLGRNFYGANARWTSETRWGAVPVRIVGGVESNTNLDHRKTFNNLAGSQIAAAPAVVPTNQDLNQSAKNLDEYVQMEIRPAEVVAVNWGLRHSNTSLDSTTNNGGTGVGSNTYQKTTGMLSAQYYVREDTNVYLAYGTGFDTPTLNQVAYSTAFLTNRVASNSGNFGLQAASTKQLELGIKSYLAETARAELALFSATTSNDVLIAVSNTGKTAYLNAPQTTRNGIELSSSVSLPHQLQWDVAYSLLRAVVAQQYTSYSVFGAKVTPITIGSGNRIPGVPRSSLYTELKWQSADKRTEAAIEGRAVGAMVANDTNAARVSGYGIAAGRLVFKQGVGGWDVSEFLRVDNIFDRPYIGSVIVNQSSSQFYEPAPGRNWAVGIKAAMRF